MSELDTPLHFGSQVEREVLHSGYTDFGLSYAASMVADPESIHVLAKGHTPQEQTRIVGVTGMTLRGNGDVTYRTATFGVEPPEVITQITDLAAGEIKMVGDAFAGFNAATRLIGKKSVREVLYQKIATHRECAIGGFVTTLVEDNRLKTTGFVSKAMAAYVEKQVDVAPYQVGRILGAVSGRERKARAKTGPLTHRDKLNGSLFIHLAALSSVATPRPGGPVVVERPFVTTF